MSVEITNIYTFDPANLIFSEPKDEQIPGTTMKNKRIQISYRYPNKKVGPLIISTLDKCFSMGIRDNFFQEKFVGLKFPIFLCQKEANEERKKEEMEWIDRVENIINAIIRYILSIKKTLGKHDFAENSFSKFIYKKLDPKGDPVPGSYSISPSIEFTRARKEKNSPEFTVDKITTLFYSPVGDSLNPIEYKDKYCNVQATLKIESVLLLAKTASIAMKAYNVIVHQSNSNPPPVQVMTFAPKPVEVCTSNNPLEGDTEGPENPIQDPDTEPEKEKPTEKPRNVKKIVKKTK
jgi:hypothetical protein